MPARILIVQNHDRGQQLVADGLEKHGYHVVLAFNGEHGIELAQKEHFDLILCDIRMPGMDGYEVVRRLKSTPSCSQTPLISIASLTWHGNHEQMTAAGFDGYISKGAAPQRFIQAVDEFLSSWERLDLY